MEIIVGERIVDEASRRNCYFVKVNVMHGDADAYTDHEFGPFKGGEHEAHLYDFLKVLSRMEGYFPRGMGGMDNYEKMQGFNPWFEEETTEGRNEEENESLRLAHEVGEYFWWPFAVGSYGGKAQYKKHSVWYVDDEGYKRSVSAVD